MSKHLRKLNLLIVIPSGLLIALGYMLLIMAAQLFDRKGTVMYQELNWALNVAIKSYKERRG
jgi:hypothetical protein